MAGTPTKGLARHSHVKANTGNLPGWLVKELQNDTLTTLDTLPAPLGGLGFEVPWPGLQVAEAEQPETGGLENATRLVLPQDTKHADICMQFS